MHPHQAEAAALVETQCINIVVGGNDPQAAAPLPLGKLSGRLDQDGPRPVPLLARVKGENLALPPVLPRHVREHAQQLPVGGLGDKSRIIQGMDQFPQTRHPETVVPGKKRLGRRLVGGLPRTNVHRTNVTAMEKRAIAPAVPTGVSVQAAAARQTLLQRQMSTFCEGGERCIFRPVA